MNISDPALIRRGLIPQLNAGATARLKDSFASTWDEGDPRTWLRGWVSSCGKGLAGFRTPLLVLVGPGQCGPCLCPTPSAVEKEKRWEESGKGHGRAALWDVSKQVNL